MNGDLLPLAFSLYLHIVLPLAGGIAGGALIAGILQAATRIEDKSIGFFSRAGGFLVAAYLLAMSFSGALTEFGKRVWGGQEWYF